MTRDFIQGSGTTADESRWWAAGLIFENCSCQSICPGHVHFEQYCTYDPCVGYWAIRFVEGELETVSLAGLHAVVAYESPRHMIEGNWTEVLIVDQAADADQRRAVEAILRGEVGGPWEILARFVGTWLPTRYLPIRVDDEERLKRIRVDGVLESEVEVLRGQDRSRLVTIDNMFNQIHSSPQVVARGHSRYDDGDLAFDIDGTHGLWSRFRWEVTGGG